MTVTYFSTLRDVLRYATTRFNGADLFFGHGSNNAFDEAAYLLLHTLKLPLDRLDPFLDARLLPEEVAALLKVVERMSSVIGLAQLGAMASMGDILLDGVEGLLGGDGGTSCIADYQFTLPELNLYPLQAGFSALLMPPIPVNADDLLVRKGRLYCTDADGAEHPYAASDFVLLSISTMPRRENEQNFSPYQLKRQALQAIGEGEASLKRAKALLLSALQQLKSSDDFTAHEANLLFDEWIDEFEQEVQRYERTGPMPIHAARTAAPVLATDVNRAAARLGL